MVGSQSYNRYSYVFNNPLKYVDPSGEGGIVVHDETISCIDCITDKGPQVFEDGMPSDRSLYFTSSGNWTTNYYGMQSFAIYGTGGFNKAYNGPASWADGPKSRFYTEAEMDAHYKATGEFPVAPVHATTRYDFYSGVWFSWRENGWYADAAPRFQSPNRGHWLVAEKAQSGGILEDSEEL